MIRVSSLVLGSFIAILATTAGCKVSVDTKTRYTEANYIVKDTAVWAGEPIFINIDGSGVEVNGGVNVTSDPSITQIQANARLLAMAFSDHKSDADLSIADIKTGFTITHGSDGIHVNCPHGGTHGDSNSGDSGCELTDIRVPIGSATQPLSITILSGNGAQGLNLSNATVKLIAANANGAGCDFKATLPATAGADISLVSNQAGDIAASLPTAFAADSVDLEADPGAASVGPFSDITKFDGSTGRGTAGTGLHSLKLTSKQFAGSSGKITLSSY
jgi:hypothetical protein